MHPSFYERHFHQDPDFPIIFHSHLFETGSFYFTLHWHESIELLYFFEGKGKVYCDGTPLEAMAGDIIVVNSDHLHCVASAGDVCRYHCLIVDKALCDSFDIHVEDILLQNKIQDATANGYFNKIYHEMTNQAPYYKGAVKTAAMSLLLHLCRNYTTDEKKILSGGSQNKIRLVKESIHYIHRHYMESIVISDICRQIGLSKFYFCRIFKEISGKTPVDYINALRCDNARKLLSTGQYNVNESAALSGFHNMSYFTKSYKRYIGALPSETIKPKFRHLK